MTTVLDKENLKSYLKIMVENEPAFMYDLMEEIKIDLQAIRKKQIEEIVNEDFKEYHDVFKALA
jgi:energy-converting hydrogenase A subunit M